MSHRNSIAADEVPKSAGSAGCFLPVMRESKWMENKSPKKQEPIKNRGKNTKTNNEKENSTIVSVGNSLKKTLLCSS
jgi:hypothetical protein